MDVPIPAAEVNPKFLHSNSTSHNWAFSAIAELIDNAYDPDVVASRIDIKYESLEKYPCLTFTDDGNGLDKNGMHSMLSFGFSDKKDKGKHKAIGQYGNGFKSGSMRLGTDAVVFSKKGNNRTIGFLSQTYLKRIGATTVLTPIVTWEKDNIPPELEEDPSMNAITEYSLFFSLGKLLEQFDEIKGDKGTRIVIYNLKRDTFLRMEFDVMIDEHDIILMDEYTPTYPAVNDKPAYKYSLRAYCTILYLTTKLLIYIRGRKVQRKAFEKTVCNTEKMTYKPSSVKTPVDIKFGFKIKYGKAKNDNEYGIMLYHNGRLIKPFVKVGYQTRPDERGVDVLGLMEIDFIKPTHNKQNFLDDSVYRSLLKALGTKLNSFWDEKMDPKNSKKGGGDKDPEPISSGSTKNLQVQCSKCNKWRRLPPNYNMKFVEKETTEWFCQMNPDANYSDCSIPEDPKVYDEDMPSTSVTSNTEMRQKTEARAKLETGDERKQPAQCSRKQTTGSPSQKRSEGTPKVSRKRSKPIAPLWQKSFKMARASSTETSTSTKSAYLSKTEPVSPTLPQPNQLATTPSPSRTLSNSAPTLQQSKIPFRPLFDTVPTTLPQTSQLATKTPSVSLARALPSKPVTNPLHDVIVPVRRKAVHKRVQVDEKQAEALESDDESSIRPITDRKTISHKGTQVHDDDNTGYCWQCRQPNMTRPSSSVLNQISKLIGPEGGHLTLIDKLGNVARVDIPQRALTKPEVLSLSIVAPEGDYPCLGDKFIIAPIVRINPKGLQFSNKKCVTVTLRQTAKNLKIKNMELWKRDTENATWQLAHGGKGETDPTKLFKKDVATFKITHLRFPMWCWVGNSSIDVQIRVYILADLQRSKTVRLAVFAVRSYDAKFVHNDMIYSKSFSQCQGGLVECFNICQSKNIEVDVLPETDNDFLVEQRHQEIRIDVINTSFKNACCQFDFTTDGSTQVDMIKVPLVVKQEDNPHAIHLTINHAIKQSKKAIDS